MGQQLEVRRFGDLTRGPGISFVPALGGLVQRLVVPWDGQGLSLLEAVPEDEIPENPWFRQVPLFPFPNRLSDGRYAFLGKQYQLPLNEPRRHNALHGFLFEEQAAISARESAPNALRVRADYRYDGGREGYPFPAHVRMDYLLLDRGAFEVTMSITNSGRGPMPIGFGFHPYYTSTRNRFTV